MGQKRPTQKGYEERKGQRSARCLERRPVMLINKESARESRFLCSLCR